MDLEKLEKILDNRRKWLASKESEKESVRKEMKERLQNRFDELRPLMDEDMKMIGKLEDAGVNLKSNLLNSRPIMVMHNEDEPQYLRIAIERKELYNARQTIVFYQNDGENKLSYTGKNEISNEERMEFFEGFEKFHVNFHKWMETLPDLQEHLILEFDEPCIKCGETWSGTTDETLLFDCPCGHTQHACSMCYASCHYEIGSEDCKGCIWEHVCPNLKRPKECCVSKNGCPSEMKFLIKDGQAYLKGA